MFKAFICGLALATATLLIRSTFRVAELSGGFQGSLANNQVSFMILEGAMVTIAGGCLAFLHPGVAFKGLWRDADFTFRKRKGGLETTCMNAIEGVRNGVTTTAIDEAKSCNAL